MDIELLSNMVGELILDHHEVGLPGLGTFVSEFVPASFSDRGYTINPPYKRVTFVPGRAEDDSLVKLYASSNGIDEDQSRAILQHFLEGTKKVLMDRKTVVFPGLGRLRATRQNNIFFITDETLDIYPEGFGLEPVSLKNHEETRSEVRHVVESLADILVEPADAAPVEPAAEDTPVSEALPKFSTGETEASSAAEEQPFGNTAGGAVPPVRPLPESIAGAGGTDPVAEKPGAGGTDPVAESSEAEEIASETHATLGAVRGGTMQIAEQSNGGVERSETVSEGIPQDSAAQAAEPAAALKKAKYARPKTKVRRHVNKWVWLAPLIVVGVAALALAVFMILVHAAPDFIDSILYTPEELRIINW